MLPHVGDARPSAINNFALAIVGPAGTGKTAVLKVTVALFVFFVGFSCPADGDGPLPLGFPFGGSATREFRYRMYSE